MALHALKYSTNVYIESRTVGLSKSFTGRYVLLFDGVSKELKLIDTLLDTERCLRMVEFPKQLGSCLFYWLRDQIWHVMFTLQGFVFDRNLQQFYGNAFLDVEENRVTLLNSHKIELKGQDLLYSFYQLDDGFSRYWIWIQRRYFEASRSIDIYRCKLTSDQRLERILSLELDEFEQHFYVTMVTLIGQKCCYFMKSSGNLYLPDDDFRTCFLEEFHYYDIKSGKHQIRQTQPFPNLDDDLDNYGIDSRHLWHARRLHLLFQNNTWGEVSGNFMHKLLIFDADTLTWTKMNFLIDDLSTRAKLVHLDTSAILTFRVQDKQSNYYSFYRCPLKQPDKLTNLSWFTYKKLNNFLTTSAIINSLPKNFDFPLK